MCRGGSHQGASKILNQGLQEDGLGHCTTSWVALLHPQFGHQALIESPMGPQHLSLLLLLNVASPLFPISGVKRTMQIASCCCCIKKELKQ